MHAMKGLPVQLEGVSHSPIQWSPCSQFVALSIYSHGETFRERLVVMNLSLEELFSTPAFDSHVDIEACVHSAWSSDCTLVGASCSLELDTPCELDICWHASMPDPGNGIAAVQAGALLAGLAPGELVQRLASGPGNSFAVVVEVPYVFVHGENGTKQPCTPLQTTQAVRAAVWTQAGQHAAAHHVQPRQQPDIQPFWMPAACGVWPPP